MMESNPAEGTLAHALLEDYVDEVPLEHDARPARRKSRVSRVNSYIQEESGMQGMNWKASMFLMTAPLVGIATMGIPKALSELGWGFGLFSLFFIGVGCCYSGMVISRTVLHLTKTSGVRPRKYGDLGKAAFGMKGERATRYMQLAYLFGACITFQHVASGCLQQVITSMGGVLCLGWSNTIISCIILIPMQAQTLEGVTLIAVMGVLSMAIVITLFLREVVHDMPPSTTTTFELSEFPHVIAGIMGMAFAFQGQSIFPEVQSEMARPQDMPKAVLGSFTILVTVYTVVGCIGYSYLGDKAKYLQLWADEYFPDSPKTTVANLCLGGHALTAYTISANVVNQSACEWLHGAPQKLSSRLGGATIPHKRISWFLVTLCTTAGAFMISNIVPLVGLLISLLGATTGMSLSFLIPFSCILKLVPMGSCEKAFHITLLVLTILVAIVGTYQTAANLINGIADGAPPFSCVNFHVTTTLAPNSTGP